MRRECVPGGGSSHLQTGDNLGFNLRSSLKPALSSTPTSPGDSISRRQLIKPGPILEAVAVWGGIQGVLTDRPSQLGSDDCRVVSVLHAQRLSCWQFLICCHLVRLPHLLSKEGGYQVGGETLLFSIPPIWCCLWLSEAKLGFLKSQHFYEMAKESKAGREKFLANKILPDFSPCYIHSPY